MHDLGAPPAVQGANTAPPPPAPPVSRRSRFARWFDSWMRSLGIAVLLFLVIRTFLLEAFQIPTSSMERTLLAGDFLFVNKAVYGAQIPLTDARMPGFGDPARGDVIVFAYPKDPSQSYVKRVIGLSGDTVAMNAGRVFLNGKLLDEPYVQHTDLLRDLPDGHFSWQRDYLANTSPEVRRRYRPTRDTWGPLVVPGEHLFVLGDNRENSHDSRYWGFVHRGAVKGRPLVVYYSYERDSGVPMAWLTEIRWGRLGSLIH